MTPVDSGFFPARVLVRHAPICPAPMHSHEVLQRTFLKHPDSKKNIPIVAIGLSLYEQLPGTTAEQIGAEVVRTQWL